jgi:hypothetical protein
MDGQRIWHILRSFLPIVVVIGVMIAPEVAPAGEHEKKPELLPDGIYLVKEGDTLWAISGRYLNDPRLWTKIWKENPFITDPQKIFPGDPVAVPGLAPPPKAVAEAPPVRREMVMPQPVSPTEALPPMPQVAVVKKPEEEIKRPEAPTIPVIPQPALECSGFVAGRGEFQQVGQIIRGAEIHEGYWHADLVFVSLGNRKTQLKERFQVIRPTEEVKHPVTGRVMGIKVRTLGTIEITGVAGQAPRARILYACEDIHVGDGLIEAKPEGPTPMGLSVPTDLRVTGYIIGSKDGGDSFGKGDIIYVDVGRDAQIVPGDEFSIYRISGIATDPQTGRVVPLSPIRRGELVVIRTSGRAATALLTRADIQVHVGDPIFLMRKMP